MKIQKFIFYFIFYSPFICFSATYYVEPLTGNNFNNGTSSTSPWKNIPGTRTANDNNFFSSNWGAITTSNKIQCGDLILLKGGSTQTSSKGGAWRIDGNYYSPSCGTSSRITIRVATNSEWSGSNGNFILNGTGITPTCVNFCGSGGVAGLVDVEGVNYVVLAGNNSGQRLEIKNASVGSGGSNGNGITVTNGNNPQGNGFKAEWLELHNNQAAGIDVSTWKDWCVANTISHSNSGPGFAIGQQNDHRVTNGGYVDVEAYNNGLAEYNGYADAFFFVGGESMWCEHCYSHDNMQRGFNSGQIWQTFDMKYRFRYIRAWDNGLSTNPNVAKVGFGFSGDDALGGSLQQNFIVGGIFYRNAQAGGWLGYGDGWIELWNCDFFGNAYTTNPDGDVKYDRSSDYAGVFNSIFQKRSYNTLPWAYGNANIAHDLKPISDYNLYVPFSSDGENFSAFNFQSGNFYSTGKTFTQAIAGQTGFTGNNDLIGTAYNPSFTATDDAVYVNNDFHLQSGSSAIDKGNFLMRANGSGTNSNTIKVLGNGNSNDPRNYFISPNSFLDALADTIEIQGCGNVVITAMTDTSITFSPACSWANGAGISLPWNGSAPDIGANEFWFPVVINEYDSENSVTIFPNPSDGKFTIAVISETKQSQIDIYNVFGEKVYSSARLNLIINLSFQPKGIYFCEIIIGNKYFRRKIIIVK